MHLLTILFNLAVSCWLGGAALFTFILTPKLFAAYSRDLAGNIVGLLFPGYFRWGLACGAVALLCQLVNRGRFAVASLLIIVLMLLLTATQAFVIEPRAAELKQSCTTGKAGGLNPEPLKAVENLGPPKGGDLFK